MVTEPSSGHGPPRTLIDFLWGCRVCTFVRSRLSKTSLLTSLVSSRILQPFPVNPSDDNNQSPMQMLKTEELVPWPPSKPVQSSCFNKQELKDSSEGPLTFIFILLIGLALLSRSV